MPVIAPDTASLLNNINPVLYILVWKQGPITVLTMSCPTNAKVESYPCCNYINNVSREAMSVMLKVHDLQRRKIRTDVKTLHLKQNKA